MKNRSAVCIYIWKGEKLRTFMMKRKEYLKEMKRSYDERSDLKDKPKVVVKEYLFDFLRAHHVLNMSNIVTKICETHKLKNKVILDIGSGFGGDAFTFYCHKNKVVIGVELSDRIKYAKKKYGRYGIDFMQGDVCSSLDEIEDESIDFVFCNLFPGHYDSGELRTSPYMNDFLKKILPKMSENAIFYYGFHTSSSGSVHPTSREDVVDYLNNNGIENSAIQETTYSAEKYPWIIFTFCKAENI